MKPIVIIFQVLINSKLHYYVQDSNFNFLLMDATTAKQQIEKKQLSLQNGEFKEGKLISDTPIKIVPPEEYVLSSLTHFGFQANKLHDNWKSMFNKTPLLQEVDFDLNENRTSTETAWTDFQTQGTSLTVTSIVTFQDNFILGYELNYLPLLFMGKDLMKELQNQSLTFLNVSLEQNQLYFQNLLDIPKKNMTEDSFQYYKIANNQMINKLNLLGQDTITPMPEKIYTYQPVKHKGKKLMSVAFTKEGKTWVESLCHSKVSVQLLPQPLFSYNRILVESISGLFSYMAIDEFSLSSLNTSYIVDFSRLFYGSTIGTLKNFSFFSTNSLETVEKMLSHCHIETLDLSYFDTTSTTNFSEMLSHTTVNNLKLGAFQLNHATDISRMFFSLEADEIDVSDINFSRIKDMNPSNLFSHCKTAHLKVKSLKNQKSHLFQDSLDDVFLHVDEDIIEF